jgi:N-acetyl-gamma-glutamylphosphate reductase
MITDAVNKHIACIGGFSLDESKTQLRLCCSIDNLLKGAATQVIQNLNYACQFNETLGIEYE